MPIAVPGSVRGKWCTAAPASSDGVLFRASCVSLTRGRLYLFPPVLSLTCNTFYYGCPSPCDVMTRIRPSARAPAPACKLTAGFGDIWTIHPDAADLLDSNVYFPAELYEGRQIAFTENGDKSK